MRTEPDNSFPWAVPLWFQAFQACWFKFGWMKIGTSWYFDHFLWRVVLVVLCRSSSSSARVPMAACARWGDSWWLQVCSQVPLIDLIGGDTSYWCYYKCRDMPCIVKIRVVPPRSGFRQRQKALGGDQEASAAVKQISGKLFLRIPT